MNIRFKGYRQVGHATGSDAVDENGLEIALPTSANTSRRVSKNLFQSDTPCYVRLTQSGVTYTAAQMHLHMPESGPYLLDDVLGNTHVYVRAVSTSTPAIVRIAPVEG